MTDTKLSPIFAPALEVDPRDLCCENGFVKLFTTADDFNKRADGLILEGDLAVEAKVLSTRTDSFWVEIGYQGKQILECTRKLRPFESPIQETFEVLLRYSGEVKEWALEVNREDYPILLVNPRSQKLSLLEVVRQEIILNEPLSPVENPDEEYGWNDPNLQEEENIDPRWAKLLELKNRKEKK